MKLIIEEVENGFIVKEQPELRINQQPVPGRKHVFADQGEVKALDSMLTFVREFHTKRPNKNSSNKDR